MENRLKELRKVKKLSQKEFAKAFNEFMEENKKYAVLDNNGKVKKVSQATISRWEGGKTPIPTKYYEALANFFDVPLSYIQGAGYSKEKIEKIILNEINLRLAEGVMNGDEIPNRLSTVLYDFLCIDASNLKAYLNLCGKSVIEKHEIPILNDELAKLLKRIYSFLFQKDFILNWDRKDLEDRAELDDFIFYFVNLEVDVANRSRLTILGKWFENSSYLENIDSKRFNEADRALKNAKISNKNMESNLHKSMINDLKYSKDSARVISSLQIYKDYIEYLISEVKSKMNSLDAEYKKENKDQQ